MVDFIQDPNPKAAYCVLILSILGCSISPNISLGGGPPGLNA